MSKLRLISLLIVSLIAIGGSSTATAHHPRVFDAELSGAQEVPVRDVIGSGGAHLFLTDENTLQYQLRVLDIDNVVQAHIHLAPRGQNGPIVAFLYGPVPPNGGRAQVELAEGELTNASLINDMRGKTILDLVEEIKKGNAYANVHTSRGGGPPGPGNFPGGEIRGQFETIF